MLLLRNTLLSPFRSRLNSIALLATLAVLLFGQAAAAQFSQQGPKLVATSTRCGRLVMPLGPTHAPQQLTVVEKIAPN